MGELRCSECGVPWVMDDAYIHNRRKEHDTFYCPNGHSQHYPGKTEEEKTIDQLREALRQERAFHTEHFRELIADRDAEHALARTCPLCGERPAAKVRIAENVTRRMIDHLQDEHGARPRLRSLPPGESARA